MKRLDMLGDGSVANSLVMWISVVLKLVKGFSIRTGTGRDGLLKARSCLRLAKISRPARTSGLQVRSQYCLSEGACRPLKHVPRVETSRHVWMLIIWIKGGCIDSENTYIYRMKSRYSTWNDISKRDSGEGKVLPTMLGHSKMQF